MTGKKLAEALDSATEEELSSMFIEAGAQKAGWEKSLQDPVPETIDLSGDAPKKDMMTPEVVRSFAAMIC